MEFHEKLQSLRKARGLTQEAAAEALYVSRAAVSKWESGRGYPSIDSLKAIAKFYGVTIDALLSGEEALTIARDDHRQKQARLRDLVFGCLDCGTGLLLVLPVFGQSVPGGVAAVSLLALTRVSPWLRTAYLLAVLAILGWGIRTLARPGGTWLSLGLTTVGTLLFILGRQPYGAAFLLVFLAIKALMLIKKP